MRDGRMSHQNAFTHSNTIQNTFHTIHTIHPDPIMDFAEHRQTINRAKVTAGKGRNTKIEVEYTIMVQIINGGVDHIIIRQLHEIIKANNGSQQIIKQILAVS